MLRLPRPAGSALSRALRASAALLATSALVGTLGACTLPGDALAVDVVDTAPASTVLPDEDPARAALLLSSSLFVASDGAIVAAEASSDAVPGLAALAAETGLPLLLGTDAEVAAELERLGATTLITAEGEDAAALESALESTFGTAIEEAGGEDVDVLAVDPSADDAAASLPDVEREGTSAALSLLVDPEASDAEASDAGASDAGDAEASGPGEDPAALARVVASAQVRAAGGSIAEIPGGDPGLDSTTVAATREAATADPSSGMLALGESFGDTSGADAAGSAAAWTRVLTMAITAPELPGGGTSIFPGRRMVALYGTPGVPSLGVLGEQDVDASIARVKDLAAEYSAHSDEEVVPAFEIITTVASDQAGSDGDYSTELSIDTLREWVDAAGEAGVYVVLDLQPGTTDFLTQAKLYEDLLKESHVGLALDAEWRLKPGQRHLEQIGSVSIEEVNETAAWLADLTAENGLPQKLLILHQFSLSMITDRQDLDTSHPELAISIHADGHGTPDAKLETWRALQRDLPDGVRMAWKNFYDEDTPTFTPEETFAIDPKPWFVSYQ